MTDYKFADFTREPDFPKYLKAFYEAGQSDGLALLYPVEDKSRVSVTSVYDLLDRRYLREIYDLTYGNWQELEACDERHRPYFGYFFERLSQFSMHLKDVGSLRARWWAYRR